MNYTRTDYDICVLDNGMSLYTETASANLYDREIKFYESNSSLDGSMYSASVMAHSRDSLDNVLHEVNKRSECVIIFQLTQLFSRHEYL